MAAFPEETFIDPEWFERPWGIHGVAHARRVLTHVLNIAPRVGLAPVEWTAATQAAAWHDIGRTHEGRDWTHGIKSVTKALDLGLTKPHPRPVVDLALFAMEYHAMWDQVGKARARFRGDAESALRVLQVLKDADGLDRVRLGPHGLDPTQLRFDCSRTMVDAAWWLWCADQG